MLSKISISLILWYNIIEDRQYNLKQLLKKWEKLRLIDNNIIAHYNRVNSNSPASH